MFYSQDILQKRGGKFGIIWLAATRGRELSRRDYVSVNVPRTCDDIIKYVTLQAAPYRHGGPRPRLSLYLSSQLMYGTVRVYNRQQQYLFCARVSTSVPGADATALHIRSHAMLSACLRDIDLQMGAKAVDHVTMGDVLSIPRRQVQDFEPYFGTMQSPDLPRPTDIPDIEVWLMPGSPVAERLPSPILPLPATPSQQRISFQPELGSPHQAPRDQITLRENLEEMLRESPIVQPGVLLPGEADLPPLQIPDEAHMPPLQTSKKNLSSEQDVTDGTAGQSTDGEPPAKRRRSKRTSGGSQKSTEPVDAPAPTAPQAQDGQDLLQLDLPPAMDLRRHLEEQGILDAEGRPDIELPAQGQLDLLELGQSGLGLLQMDLGQGDVMELGREQMEAAEKDAAVQGQMEEGQGDRTQQTVVSGTDAMTTMRLEDVAPLAPTEETPAVQPAPENLRPQPRPTSPGVTPRSPPREKRKKRQRKLDLSLQLSPMQETPPITPSRRRRQISFADPEIQISKKRLRRNLETSSSTTRELVLPHPEPLRMTELFNQPGRKGYIPKTLRNLWERNCRTRPQDISEEDRRIWSVPELLSDAKTSSSSERESPLARPLIPDIPLSPVREMETIVQEMEELREASLSRGQGSHYLSVGDISHDVTPHRSLSHSRDTPLISAETPLNASAKSQSNLLTESRLEDVALENILEEAEHMNIKLPHLDLTIPGGEERQQRSLTTSEDLGLELLMASVTSGVDELQQQAPMPSIEEQVNQLEEAAAQSSHVDGEIEDILMRSVMTETSRRKWTTFRIICPLTESRVYAAHCFTTLLELCAKQKVVVRQKEAYGDIYIAKGSQH